MLNLLSGNILEFRDNKTRIRARFKEDFCERYFPEKIQFICKMETEYANLYLKNKK